MKTDAKHTPTPWKAEKMGDKTYILNESGWVLAHVGGKLSAYRKAHEANAAFIVRAVNAHEEQRQTLSAIRARIAGEFDHPDLLAMGPLMGTQDDIIKWCKAAIAKAEGRNK